MKPITKTGIGVIILVKIALGSILVYQIEPDNFFFDNSAIAAETTQRVAEESANAETFGAEETIDLKLLAEEKAELKTQEAILDKKRQELSIIQEDVRKKLKVLSRLRREINAQMASKKSMDDRKLKHLLKVYSAMKPQQAAEIGRAHV